MSFFSVLSICIGASLGALFRFWLGLSLNTIFPTIPLGTWVANMIGGFLIGVFIAVSKSYPFIPEVGRLAIATGFLGGLTTFSTFSGETVTLIVQQEYLWSMVIIGIHVIGSIVATLLGMYTVKFIMT